MEFEHIYTTYFNDVFRYIRKLTNNEQLAEEITAETFFKAMNALDSFRGDSDIRVWLCQIAKNQYLSYLRKTKKSGSTENIDQFNLPDTRKPVEDTLILRDEAARIRKILHHIGEPYKEVFMWRVFAELSFRQIGQIFHKSENWACVTYHRARRKIKERLEANEDEQSV